MVRFADGRTTSLDLIEGREGEDLLRHMGHFPDREVRAVEEQVYDALLPRRFRYQRRKDLEDLLRDHHHPVLQEGESP